MALQSATFSGIRQGRFGGARTPTFSGFSTDSSTGNLVPGDPNQAGISTNAQLASEAEPAKPQSRLASVGLETPSVDPGGRDTGLDPGNGAPEGDTSRLSLDGRAASIGSIAGTVASALTGVSGLSLVGRGLGAAYEGVKAFDAVGDFNKANPENAVPAANPNVISGVANAFSPFGVVGKSFNDQARDSIAASDGLSNPGGRSQTGSYDFDTMTGNKSGETAPAPGGTAPLGDVTTTDLGAPEASTSSSGGGESQPGEGGWGSFAKGGSVTRSRLRGPNPPGPDDGEAGLDVGEYVVTRAKVRAAGGGKAVAKAVAAAIRARR